MNNSVSKEEIAYYSGILLTRQIPYTNENNIITYYPEFNQKNNFKIITRPEEIVVNKYVNGDIIECIGVFTTHSYVINPKHYSDRMDIIVAYTNDYVKKAFEIAFSKFKRRKNKN